MLLLPIGKVETEVDRYAEGPPEAAPQPLLHVDTHAQHFVRITACVAVYTA